MLRERGERGMDSKKERKHGGYDEMDIGHKGQQENNKQTGVKTP